MTTTNTIFRVTADNLTDDQILAELKHAQERKDKRMVDTCRKALIPDGQRVVPVWRDARERIAARINERYRAEIITTFHAATREILFSQGTTDLAVLALNIAERAATKLGFSAPEVEAAFRTALPQDYPNSEKAPRPLRKRAP